MTRLLLAGLGLTACATQALAFAPTNRGLDLEPIRVRTTHADAQARLYASPAWRAFTAGEGAGWLARFDELTGTPHRMWGPGLPMGDTQREVVANLLALVDRHPDLFGATSSDVTLRTAARVASADAWYLDLDVLVEGVPVYDGGITARVKNGRLVMLGVDTYPKARLFGTQVLTADEALAAAQAQGPAPRAAHTREDTRLVWLPVEIDGAVALRLAWQTRTRTESPVGIWVSFVDAESGALLNVHDEVRHAEGQLSAEHDVRTVNGEMTVSPLPYVRILEPAGDVLADRDGRYDLVDTAGEGQLRGRYFRVVNNAGDNASFAVTGDHTLTSADATQAELDTYVFLHQVREWGAAVAPEVSLVDRLAFTANVNLNETCNAYYDGRSVNFFRAGSGCNNTGRIADVVYHEWGHGFHDTSILAGSFDGSLSEGAADVVAFLQTGDPIIAPYFDTRGSGIRNVAPDKVYPDDFVASQDYVHSNGLIFGGAIWDLWGLARAELGEEEGTRVTTAIFTGLLKGGPTIATSYDEALFADDDDGDLGNGTPNQCLLIDAFLPHGLGPAGGALVLPVHEPLAAIAADTEVPVEVELVNLAGACIDGTATGGTLAFRVDGGAWEEVPMTATGGRVSASLPALPLGTLVEYYLTVDTTDGGSPTLPRGGMIHPFTLYVGDVLELYCNDFENDGGGFVSELLAGEPTDGANDWQWGTPVGLSGDPDQAFSGRRVWGNDLGGDNFNGAYQDDKHNRLTTPEIDTRHYLGSFLQYRRWLNVEDGIYDRANILADGVPVWSNFEGDGEDHTADSVWAPHAVLLGEQAEDKAVAISWEIQSDGGLGFGGWTIDDVCVYAPATPDNRLGISDFAATQREEGRTVDLTWTNPLHAPLTEVVVVRSRDGWPTSPEDGEEVYRDANPEIGASIRIEDKVKRGKPYYYAVYASDGEHWLSWTREGFNADIGSTGNLEGCGCTTAPATGASWLGLGLIGLILRRRRS